MPPSSSVKVPLPKGPSAVKPKPVPPAGSETFSMVMVARAVLVNVQVTVSPTASAMLDGSEPSEQVALVRSQPASGVSVTS